MITFTNPRTRLLAVTATLSLLAGACTSEPAADTADENTTSQSATTTPEWTTSTVTETTKPAANSVVAEAVDNLVEVGTYAFEAKIMLSLQDQPTEVELEGWVDGSDRELVMKIGDQQVTTRVIDGVATVERDGETTEVPLTEAGSAPSILILKEIENAMFETDTTITGELAASDLASSTFEVTGSASITVMVTSGGQLAGYTMAAEDESWSVEVKFDDIGEHPNR